MVSGMKTPPSKISHVDLVVATIEGGLPPDGIELELLHRASFWESSAG